MKPGWLPAVGLAVLAAAACPAVLAGPGASAAEIRALAAASGPGPTGVPAPGSIAAREVGGRLMASTGVVVANPAWSGLKLPQVPASAWLVANAGTGQVLAAKDPHGEYGPASTLKVLTAITLIPRLNPAAMIPATKLATSVEPVVAGLITGRKYPVASLFKALLLMSANDAAVALTQAAGSFATGMALINGEARHLQAYDVVAKVPNGLPAAGQVESAYDEALIARQALAMPAFMRYDETLTSKLEIKPHDWLTFVNQNALLTHYRGGIGGKIGWTIKSEATYVGMARRNGVTLIVTLLHCTPLQEIAAGERLLDWGFAMNGKVTPVGQLVPPLENAAASRPQLAAGGPRTARAARAIAVASPRPASHDGLAGYVVAGAAFSVAGLGLGGLVGARRRMRPGSRETP